MSIRFQADNDLKRIIVDATLRRAPSIDFQTAQAAGLDDLDDELVLRCASEQASSVTVRFGAIIRCLTSAQSPDQSRDREGAVPAYEHNITRSKT